MKQIILTLLFATSFLTLYSQNDSTALSTVCIYRSTGFTGSARQFKVFMDGNLICKIKNECYSEYTVSSGTHVFAVQMDGQVLNENTETIEIKTEPDKKYYLVAILEVGSMWSYPYFFEVTENSIKGKFSKLKKVNCGQ